MKIAWKTKELTKIRINYVSPSTELFHQSTRNISVLTKEHPYHFQTTHLGASRHFKVPKLHMAVSYSNKIRAILCEADSLDLAGKLVGSDFYSSSPIPHIDNHVMLGSYGDYILLSWRKCLKKEKKKKSTVK